MPVQMAASCKPAAVPSATFGAGFVEVTKSPTI